MIKSFDDLKTFMKLNMYKKTTGGLQNRQQKVKRNIPQNHRVAVIKPDGYELLLNPKRKKQQEVCSGVVNMADSAVTGEFLSVLQLQIVSCLDSFAHLQRGREACVFCVVILYFFNFTFGLIAKLKR